MAETSRKSSGKILVLWDDGIDIGRLTKCLEEWCIPRNIRVHSYSDQNQWNSEKPQFIIFCYNHNRSSASIDLKKKLQNIQKTHACEIKTITEAELDIMCGRNMDYPEAMRNMASKMKKMDHILQDARGSMDSSQRLDIGIFSRSDTDSHSWLKDVLRSRAFDDHVREVKSCYISNSFSQFSKNVSQCRFAILYHTKNMGRINITDIADSLYDEELRYLCDTLGKEKVIVVIDDVDDSSDQKKRLILQEQPSAKERTRDVFLISKKEKGSDYMSYLSEQAAVKTKLKNIIMDKTRGDETQKQKKGFWESWNLCTIQ